MLNKEFIEWLLYSCTIKTVIYSNGVGNFWTLNDDYLNSWDGEDVKLYTTDEIFEIYSR